MGTAVRFAALLSVTFAATHHKGACVLAGVLVLGGVGCALAISDSPSRGDLVAALQRPAVSAGPSATAVRASSGHAVARLGADTFFVALVPNRASGPNRLSVSAMHAGRPVAGARVTVSFSMPAMNMWSAFSAHLGLTGPGRYAVTMPFVGMAGKWRLDVRVTAPGDSGTEAFAVTDALGS